MSPDELDTSIRQAGGREAVHVPWTSLLRYRQAWPFLIGKMLTDPVWWFYLYWLPSYLERERGQNPLKSALLLAVIYTGSSVGSIAGGWLSGLPDASRLAGRRRAHADDARCAVCMPGSIFAYYTTASRSASP